MSRTHSLCIERFCIENMFCIEWLWVFRMYVTMSGLLFNLCFWVPCWLKLWGLGVFPGAVEQGFLQVLPFTRAAPPSLPYGMRPHLLPTVYAHGWAGLIPRPPACWRDSTNCASDLDDCTVSLLLGSFEVFHFLKKSWQSFVLELTYTYGNFGRTDFLFQFNPSPCFPQPQPLATASLLCFHEAFAWFCFSDSTNNWYHALSLSFSDLFHTA